jgi:hypothetical protein
MGELIDTPHSKVSGALAILDRLGVTQDDLARFRRVKQIQNQVAMLMKTGYHLPRFEIWRTFELGHYKSGEEYKKALAK